MDVWSCITMMIRTRRRKANKCVVSGRLYSDGELDTGVRSIHARLRSSTDAASGSHYEQRGDDSSCVVV